VFLNYSLVELNAVGEAIQGDRPDARAVFGTGFDATEAESAFAGKPASAPDFVENAAAPALPSAPPAVTLNAKANGVSLADFQAKGWTVDLLKQHGYID
jgi:hypothetical protein